MWQAIAKPAPLTPIEASRVWAAASPDPLIGRTIMQWLNPPRKAQLLTEEEGFGKTYFLALGVGLGLLVVLSMVYVISTPRFVPRAKLFFLCLFYSNGDLIDEGFKQDVETGLQADCRSMGTDGTEQKAERDKG